MRKFQDLNDSQKEQSIDFLFTRNLNALKKNHSMFGSLITQKMCEIKQAINFCSCTNCNILLFKKMEDDAVLTELIRDESTRQAHLAFYPEENDIIVKVK